MEKILYGGIDIGSTTIKLVIMDDNKNIIYSRYERHLSNVRETLKDFLFTARKKFKNEKMKMTVTGSGGLTVSKWMGLPFVQEVISCVKAINETISGVDVAVELGGEDAKITFFTNGVEQRMNSACAGGTGAFIDQMAQLLNTDAGGLNDLANNAKEIYPIAARCGVFAKSDIQPLINEGVRREDIAISIFQSVVNQTISGLACGRPIRGKVVFLGGPLTFLPNLKKRFQETLKLDDENAITPKNGELYVALGAAMTSIDNKEVVTIDEIIERLEVKRVDDEQEITRMKPLFDNKEQYARFKDRHAQANVKVKDLNTYQGDAYLGIDAGSTTTKLVLIDDEGNILHQHYSSNEGEPLKIVKEALEALYDKLPEGVTIRKSATTGYGENLIKAAFKIDIGIIETVAHYKAADHFLPGVDYILDIGGQDMKCMTTHEGIIQTVTLNEACSSGCGSFIENFAESLEVTVPEFVEYAIKAKEPVDLGSRCTVFMNSRVKQAQKEGASIGDISSGLAYSVVKNALFKVIRLRSKEDLGDKVIVQGGTFLNDAVLRAFEVLTLKEVIRPNIAGVMGAYGCALIAKEDREEKTTLINKDDLENIDISSSLSHCGLCSNNCALTIYDFLGKRYVTGNRCERGLGEEIKKTDVPNLYEYKNNRFFNYKPVKKTEAKYTVGIPRVLNMYENYPFWFTFFKSLGIRVVLSPPSSKRIYNRGIETIPSESVCYPAKLAHGHIDFLLEKDVDFIWFPSVMYETTEDKGADNCFNCPVVQGYPEVIRINVDGLKEKNVPFLNPFLSFIDDKLLGKNLYKTFKDFGYSLKEVEEATKDATNELNQAKKDLQAEGERALKYLNDNELFGIVLAGRPYHTDPEINHGIDRLVASYGFVVFTEDSLAHLGSLVRPLRTVDQWSYHNRLYRVAEFVARQPNLELIQLTSFGCGLDAVTSDQVKEILESHNKIYTVIKIDEVDNLGAIRIRVRSLQAAIKKRHEKCILPTEGTTNHEKALFTEEMKKTHTILAPQMSPIHFELLEPVMNSYGYKVEILKETTALDEDTGLKYVHNDACYPSILVVGQLLRALESGRYDKDKVALIITQTGGACRATNYIAFIRKSLKDLGLEHIPVISLSAGGLEEHPGFNVSLKLLNKGMQALVYGDLLMKVLYRVRPYEIVKGSAIMLYEKYNKLGKAYFSGDKTISFNKLTRKLIKEFDNLPINDVDKPKVGLVGEILVKFHPYANNNVVDIVENEGGEAVMPSLYDFFLYGLKNNTYKSDEFGYKKHLKPISNLAIWYLEKFRKNINKDLEKSNRFTKEHKIENTAKNASEIVSLLNQAGEGWFLTGEMINLIKDGAPNIICMQPFACLPNHVVGKGVIKGIRSKYENANIVAIDYDPGVSNVNQLNRIKLMMGVAHENLQKEVNIKG